MNDFLELITRLFNQYKTMAEKAMAQLSDEQINELITEESNSVSLIVKHLRGNMISRSTDFLTSDGEKTWRNRDSEFEGGYANKEELMKAWNEGWQVVFDAVKPLTADDLMKIVYIRNEPQPVMEALIRQFGHYASHIGQIVFLAKALAGENWKTLSIPRGKSEEFNREHAARQANQPNK
jgi:Protein of unknown function (DUF1572)